MNFGRTRAQQRRAQINTTYTHEIINIHIFMQLEDLPEPLLATQRDPGLQTRSPPTSDPLSEGRLP